MNRFAKLFFVAVVVMFAATSMFATNTATANIAVSANINSNCQISASPLAFGAYDELGVNASSDLKQTTTVTVTCVDETGVTVSLDQGLYPKSGSTASTPLRQMQGGTDNLAYFLYQDSDYSIVWGADTSAQTVTADGQPYNYTVYGAVTAGQQGHATTYSDTVVATISY